MGEYPPVPPAEKQRNPSFMLAQFSTLRNNTKVSKSLPRRGLAKSISCG